MFGKTTAKRFLINWLIIMVFGLIIMVVGFGYNSITGQVVLSDGLGVLGSLFGGVLSLGGIVLVCFFGALLVVGLIYVMRKDYTGKNRLFGIHLTIGLVVLVLLIFVGVRWINIPTDSIGPAIVGLLIGLVLTLVTTALVTTSRTRKAAPAENKPTATPHRTARVATPATD